ncbi:MAG: hypothetical protein ACOCSL_00625 [Thermoplasmatota archaeon]
MNIDRHYFNQNVKEIILNWCKIENSKEALRSIIGGHSGWYRYNDGKKALIPATEEEYAKLIERMKRNEKRSLYHSLNYFDISVFNEWIDSDESPGGYAETLYYGLGTDIDMKDKEKIEAEKDRDVSILEDREWLEKAVEFHINWLAENGISKEIIKPYFSGNGAYIIIDPSVIKFRKNPQKREKVCRAYNKIIKKIEKDFFEEHLEAKEYVQFDALNNSKRQWKTPLSIHKSKDLACVPLDVDNPEIDLEKAKIPVSEEMIQKTKEWIKFVPEDQRKEYLIEMGELINKPILDENKTPVEVAEEEIFEVSGTDLQRNSIDVDLDLDNKEAIPLCIQNLLSADSQLSHARGKGLLALFLNKIGLDKKEAREKWNKLTTKAGGPKTNIFESWYNDELNLPSCETIQKPGSGYPAMEFGDIGLCDTDETCECEHIDNPGNYIKEKTMKDIIPSEVNADLVGERIKLRGRIIRQKEGKALPKKLFVRCRECGESTKFEIDNPEIKKQMIFKGRKRLENVKKDISKYQLQEECSGKRENHDFIVETLENMDYSIIWLKDNLEDIDNSKGNHDIELKVAVLEKQLPRSRKVELKGELTVDPVSTDLVLIADEIESYELVPEELEFTDEMIENFSKYFGSSIEEEDIDESISAKKLHYCTNPFRDTNEEKREKEGISAKNLHYCTNGNTTTIDIRKQIAPDMVGRDLVREARLLVLHSPIIIPDIDNSKHIRGSLREILFGDTKTFKSESVKDITEKNYSFGEYTVAETSSRAGLSYSVDTDRRALTWGVLPLNDRGYVGIDGLNDLHQKEMVEFREVLESQKVIVRKFISGEANARVRISACMNPPEPMNQYLNPCEALKDTYIFKRTPDLTRWDIFIPFNDSDIEKRKIANRKTNERPIPDDIFKNHVLWAWSRSPGDIEYTEEAVERIKEEAPDLIEVYGISELPIVHNGIRDVLTRISVAFACLKHSSEDNETVIVKEEHVEYAVEFYTDMIEKLGITEYKKMIEEDLKLTQDDFIDIIEDIDKTHIGILDQIKLGPKSSHELSEELNKSKSTIKNKYNLLKEYDLIKTKPSKGITLTKKGVRFIRKFLGFEDSKSKTVSAIVQESCTNENVEDFKDTIEGRIKQTIKDQDNGEGVNINDIADGVTEEDSVVFDKIDQMIDDGLLRIRGSGRYSLNV